MHNEILPGLSVDASGQVTVEKSMGELLFNFALQLEDTVSAPVDVEHVLAAIVLAAREGEINSDTHLAIDNAELLEVLRRHLKTVFERYRGQLGRDD